MSFDLGDNPVAAPPTEGEISQMKQILGLTSEDIANALDSYLGGGSWRGGDTAMTGEDIVAAIDALLGSEDWKQVNAGPAGADAAYMRPFTVNRLLHEDIISATYSVYEYVSGTSAVPTHVNTGFGFANAMYPEKQGLPDGVTNVTIFGALFDSIPATQYGYFTWPTSVSSIVSVAFGSISGFGKLLDFLEQQTWIESHSAYGGLLDFSGGIYGGSGENALFTAAQQYVIDTLISRGWSVLTPEYNTPAGFGYYLISSASNVGIANRQLVDADGTQYVAVGDGADLPISGALYVCDIDSTDPLDWQFVGSSFAGWPGRTEHVTSKYYYIAQTGSDFYVTSRSSQL